MWVHEIKHDGYRLIVRRSDNHVRLLTRRVLYALDLLEMNGEDFRSEPLEKRKAKLKKLLSRRLDGIMFNEHLSMKVRSSSSTPASLGWKDKSLGEGEEPAQPGHATNRRQYVVTRTAIQAERRI